MKHLQHKLSTDTKLQTPTMTTPLTASLPEQAQMKYKLANPQNLAKYLGEAGDNSDENGAKNIDYEIYYNRLEPDSSSICIKDDGRGMSIDCFKDFNNLYSSWNTKNPIEGQPRTSQYGVGVHDMGMTLCKEMETVSKHGTTPPFGSKVDYNTCKYVPPTELSESECNLRSYSTVITMRYINSRHIEELYESTLHPLNRFISSLEQCSRIAIARGTNITVSLFKTDIDGRNTLWKKKTLEDKPFIDPTKSIPGGIKNADVVIPVEIIPFVNYDIELYVKKELEHTYSDKDIEPYFQKLHKDVYDIQTTTNADANIPSSLKPTYDQKTRYEITGIKGDDQCRPATARIFASKYSTKQISFEKLTKTHVLIGKFPIEQYCYASTQDYGERGGLSIKTALKQTALLKCEINAQGSGQIQRYEQTYGCILNTDPTVTLLPPKVTSYFIHLLQEKASIDISCYDPKIINILMYQRAQFTNFINRHNKLVKRVGTQPTSVSPTIPSTTVDPHTRCEHVRWRAIMERAQKTMALSIQPTLNSILQHSTVPGTDEIADAATQIENDMTHLLGRIKDFQTLVTTPP